MTNEKFINCAWGYSCTKSWQDLIGTKNKTIKFCSDCQREVYQVETKHQLAEYVYLNRCVYFNSGLLVQNDDFTDLGEHMLLGDVMPPEFLKKNNKK